MLFVVLAADAAGQPARLRSNVAAVRELVVFGELERQSDIAPVNAQQYARAADVCMQLHYYRQALNYKQKAIAIDSFQCDSAYVEILRCNGLYKEAAATCYRLFRPLPQNLVFALSLSAPNPLSTAQVQRSVTAPGFIYALSCTDTTLQFSATGIPVDPLNINLASHQLGASPLSFRASLSNTGLGYPDIETALPDQCSYTVTHPQGITYHTMQDATGRSWLYEERRRKNKNGTPKLRRVKFQGFSMTVEHPVFTRDGHIMVFASDYEGGYGGYDLWYSELEGGRWKMPHNLGKNINTDRDELSPSILGDYLLFASNGHIENFGGLDIYSTHLMDWDAASDTVGTVSLGHNTVQNMLAPVNSPYDDLEYAATEQGLAFWISYRDTATLSGRIYSHQPGAMPVMLHGNVYDNYGTPLGGVKISLMQGVHQLYETQTGIGGNYHIFLREGETYNVQFEKAGYFRHTLTVKAERGDSHDLIVWLTRSITMSGYQTNLAYGYLDVFEPNAGVELTDEGCKSLADFARFARENQHLDIQLTLLCRHTADKKFNDIVNRHRASNLTTWLCNQGVPRSNIKVVCLNELPPDYHLQLHTGVKNALWITFINK